MAANRIALHRNLSERKHRRGRTNKKDAHRTGEEGPGQFEMYEYQDNNSMTNIGAAIPRDPAALTEYSMAPMSEKNRAGVPPPTAWAGSQGDYQY